jgi:nucleotide sugar dehydrogenase
MFEKGKIGFIGQGWIGKNYADDFEERGYKVVRYDLEKYQANKEELKTCPVAFVAVPTPSTPQGFDDSILIDAIKSATIDGQVVVIKSTIKLGTTDKVQKMFPERYIIHSPEFLTEKTARHDVARPFRNILGYTAKSHPVCGRIMNILPIAPYESIVPCREAEFVKYMGNIWFYFKVMAINTFYDIATKNGLDYDSLKDILHADPRIGRSHSDPAHQGGRGAGGHCFIKDMAAFHEMYEDLITGGQDLTRPEREQLFAGLEMIKSLEEYNKILLKSSGKSLDLLKGVYGE